MARIPYPESEDLSPKTQEVLGSIPDLNVYRVLSHADSAIVPWLGFSGALLSKLEIDVHLREMVILHVSKKSGSDYVWIQHENIARELGVPLDAIDAIERGQIDSEVLLPDARALLKFADQVYDQPRADEEAFEALRDLFPPRQIVEVLLVIGNYRMIAGVLNNLDVDMDDPVQPGDYQRADDSRES